MEKSDLYKIQESHQPHVTTTCTYTYSHPNDVVKLLHYKHEELEYGRGHAIGNKNYYLLSDFKDMKTDIYMRINQEKTQVTLSGKHNPLETLEQILSIRSDEKRDVSR